MYLFQSGEFMKDHNILHKMALERCRMTVSHLCAYHHLFTEEFAVESLIASLNKDIEFMERLVNEGEL